MISDVVTLLQRIGSYAGTAMNYVQTANAYNRSGSLLDVAKLTRVEPLTVVSKDCMTLDYLPDIMQTLLNVFSAYYLQAVSIYGQIDSVRIQKILDRLNPDRDKLPGYMLEGDIGANFKEGSFGFESMKDRPTLCLENYKHKLPSARISTEDMLSTSKDKLNPISTSGKLNGDNNKALNEIVNLAVGKILEVKISVGSAGPNIKPTKEMSGTDKITIPVSVRLVPALLSNNSIGNILTLKNQDNSLIERFHAWRSGRIEFIKDLVFCQDLIDAHKKAMMEDQDGVYSEIVRRANNARIAGLATKTPSLAAASNLFIISEEVAKDVERKLGGKLSNANIRNKAFENTYAMIIVVVDREWERITFYQRGMPVGSTFSIKEIKVAGQGKGPDILDILKAMNMGGQMNF